jgi:hypothetical protein
LAERISDKTIRDKLSGLAAEPTANLSDFPGRAWDSLTSCHQESWNNNFAVRVTQLDCPVPTQALKASQSIEQH